MRAGKVLLALCVFVNIAFASDKPQIGEQAPTFFLRTVDGETFFLSKQVGAQATPANKSPLVFSFFATWCIPCKAEIPVLHQLQEEFSKVKFYLVNVEEKPELVKKYVAANDINLPILMDVYSVVAKKYGIVNTDNVAVLPQLVLIDSGGKLVYMHEGYQAGDEKDLREHLNKIINEATIDTTASPDLSGN